MAKNDSPGAKLTLLVFGGALCAGLGVVGYGLYMRGVDPAWSSTLLKWGVGLSVVFAIPLFLPPATRANLSVSLVVVELSLFGFNAYLAHRPPPSMAKSKALDEARAGTPGFDLRNQREVLQDLRARGIEAWPALYGLHRMQDDDAPEDLFPLGGISTSTVVACNELGDYMIYETDEHGFNNPRPTPERVDVVIVGDSYAQGQCVPRGEELAGQLRKRGYSVYSAGSGGNGPLLDLAALVEYGLPLSPGVVIWVFSGNDYGDLLAEQLQPMLVRYVEDPAFRQGLIDRQEEIDAYWRDLVERKGLLEPAPTQPKRTWTPPTPTFRELATLHALRGLLGLHRANQGTWRKMFDAALGTAKAHVEAAGGKMYFAPMPHYEMLDAPRGPRRGIYDLVEAHGIEVVDVDGAFQAHEDFRSMFPLRMAGHFAPSGYAFVADQVEAAALRGLPSAPTSTAAAP